MKFAIGLVCGLLLFSLMGFVAADSNAGFAVKNALASKPSAHPSDVPAASNKGKPKHANEGKKPAPKPKPYPKPRPHPKPSPKPKKNKG